MRCSQTTFVFVLQPCSEKRYAVSVCGRFPYIQSTAVRYRVLTIVLPIAVCWFFQNGEIRSQESNYMYSSSVQNTQLTEKSVGITIRIFPDYPIEKSQYLINKKISGYYPIRQNFLSGALSTALANTYICTIRTNFVWGCLDSTVGRGEG